LPFPIVENLLPVAHFQRLQVRRPLVTDNRRRAGSCLDASFDLQALCRRLVVLRFHVASLDATLDLQAVSHGLVAVKLNPASFHIRFDFHVFPFYEIGVNCQASAADMNSSVGSACLDVRFDFHTYGFLSRKID
jgi:hypothetical protein